MINDVIKSFREKLVKISFTITKTFVVLFSMIVGFLMNEGYHFYKEKSKVQNVSKLPNTRTHTETSISRNERHELIIMDRADGSYVIYSDSVGKMIFNQYAIDQYINAKKY